MRLRASLLLLPALLQAATTGGFRVLADDPGAWPQVLSAIGFQAQPSAAARILVLRPGASASPEWQTRVEQGALLILEGESSAAEMFGFRRSNENVRVASVEDVHRPKLSIVWQTPVELPRFVVPRGVRVFAKERWSGAPLVAGFHQGSGAVLWLAAPIGQRGYERFPYLPQALVDLGLDPPLRSSRLWAFFDSSYRSRVDVDYFAQRWRASGIAALQVAAWHFYDHDPEREDYAPIDYRLSPGGHPGLCLARVAAGEREVLERSSGVARKDRRPARRPTGLAQTHEPGEPGMCSGCQKRS